MVSENANTTSCTTPTRFSGQIPRALKRRYADEGYCSRASWHAWEKSDCRGGWCLGKCSGVSATPGDRCGTGRRILRRTIRSHARYFLCVFADYFDYCYYFFFLSRSYTNSSIFVLAVGNTPYGKRRNSRTESPFWLQSILEESLHSRQSFCATARSIRHILPPEKRRRNERYKVYSSIYWSMWKTYEFSRDWCCLTLNFGNNANHSYCHQFKRSPAFRKALAQQRNYTG